MTFRIGVAPRDAFREPLGEQADDARRIGDGSRALTHELGDRGRRAGTRHRVVEHLGEHVALGSDRVVDRLHGDAGLIGDRLDRRSHVPALEEQPAGRLHDLEPCRLGLGLPAPAPPGLDIFRHVRSIWLHTLERYSIKWWQAPRMPDGEEVEMATTGTGTGVVFRPAGEGPAVWSMGMLFERVLGATESGGGMGLALITQAPGSATPLHVHHRESEAFFLLEGSMTYRAGEDVFKLEPGGFIYLPSGLPHAFRITGVSPTRFLALATPAALLSLYEEIGGPAQERRLRGHLPPCRTSGAGWRRPVGTASRWWGRRSPRSPEDGSQTPASRSSAALVGSRRAAPARSRRGP